MKNSLFRALVGEFIGTFILGSFGLMALAVSVTTGVLDFYGCLFAFCFIVGLAVIFVAPICGAYLNPAVVLGMAVFGDFPKKRVIPFWIAEVLGAFCGALVLYALYGNAITAFEAANGIVRGTPESSLTAMIFCCYTPHPAIASAIGWDSTVMNNFLGIFSEFLGTAFLIVAVMAFNDTDNDLGPRKGLFGFMIGLVLLVECAVLAPVSMAAVNPARDLGPRLAAAILGWGGVAFPGLPNGQGGQFWIYIVGPMLGGLAGAAFWNKLCKPMILRNKAELKVVE